VPGHTSGEDPSVGGVKNLGENAGIETRPMKRSATAGTALALAALCACKTVGPPGVLLDRFDYAEAISRSWKENMLLNLVKLRYADAPVFLDVSSIVSQYSLQGQLSAGGQIPGFNTSHPATVGAQVIWADRPTITYQPLTGQRFTKSLLTTIKPQEIMDLVQAGWPVDVLFRVAVRSINGIQAGSRNRMSGQTEDPRFEKLLEAMRRLQQKGAIGVRVERKGKDEASLMVISRTADEEITRDRLFMDETLGIEPGQPEYHLAMGAVSSGKDEIALLTRSVIEVLGDLSFDVEVPAEHERDGRVGPPLSVTVQRRSGFKVFSGTSRPFNAFAAVRYEDYWFWIDDRDFESKRALSFMMVLLALSETGGGLGPPALTLSTGP
jgi:hypothetical protein